MSYTTTQWRQAIDNLLRKTSRKEVSWSLSELYKADVWSEVTRSLECTLGDKVYVVSELRRRHYVSEDEYYWGAVYDFSVFKNSYDHEKLASAPEDLSIISKLFDAAEGSFAFDSDALGGLL